MLKKYTLPLFFILLLPNFALADSYVCNGKFPHPINDYCWSCVFPLKIAGFDLPFISGQEDKQEQVDRVCTCGQGADLILGLTTSFWEPTTLVDVVRKPFCLAGLGGIDMGDIVDAPKHGRQKTDGGVSKDSFYHVHWYINPILSWVGLAVDNSCVDQMGFDLAYLTELDPLWNDEEMAAILSPDIFLFANPVAQLACAADCVTASAGFPLNKMYWCAGCQGSIMPLTGTVNNHIGMVDSTSLMLQKFAHKAHRELMIWGASGKDGACYKYPKYLMDKTDYKYTMVFPKPQKKIAGKCCQPFGRTTALWGSMKEIPYKGEDAVYQVFRKRDCCVGASVLNMVK